MKSLGKLMVLLLIAVGVFAQQRPYRVGTTAANFLEMGVGSAGVAMGDAYVSVTRDVTSIFWNPAGLGYMESNQVSSMTRPWIAGITHSFAGIGVPVPRIGTLALGMSLMDYGSIEETTMDLQEGTGSEYTATEYAVSMSYGRRIANWFSFGLTGKYITSRISRLTANALAMDLGVMINTGFFSPTGTQQNGMSIGMSISNYGTRMKYEGMELLRPIDIAPDQHGNYENVEGEFKTQGWDLPIIFRMGVSIHPIVTNNQKLTLSVDALHPNNNSESVNMGAEYQLRVPGIGRFFLRGGWHGFFMENSPYGFTFGGAVHITLLNNVVTKVGYAFQNTQYFDSYSSYSLGLEF